MSERTVVTTGEEETKQLAEKIGREAEAGDIFCLKGTLGAGKTHFVKGFVRAFGILEEAVSSPTFTLVHEYDGSLPVYHFDCYRLNRAEEAIEIGAEEYFYGTGVCIIEWPERIEPILPSKRTTITFTITGEQTRTIRIEKT
ncbi:MAG: tRNA (adenosine(37)-N6)-threonylcarbamoyltransferase complex ATPase subunit type 1 TsaE [Balneolaceae bacterium]